MFVFNCYREVVDVEKEVEKSDAKDEVVKKSEVEKNGDIEEKTENGSEANGKPVENGNVEENGVSEKEVSTESSGIYLRLESHFKSAFFIIFTSSSICETLTEQMK